MPSKEEDGAGAVPLTVDCAAASGARVAAGGKPWSGRSLFGCVASSLRGGIVARRGDTSFFADVMTTAPDASLSFAPAGMGSTSMSASAHTTTVVALSISLFSLSETACGGRERYVVTAVLSSAKRPGRPRCCAMRHAPPLAAHGSPLHPGIQRALFP